MKRYYKFSEHKRVNLLSFLTVSNNKMSACCNDGCLMIVGRRDWSRQPWCPPSSVESSLLLEERCWLAQWPWQVGRLKSSINY